VVAASELRPELAIDLRIVPEAEAVRVVRSQLRSLLEAHGFAEKERERFLLGFDEVLVNACVHAGTRERGERVELSVALFRDRVEVEVMDRGEFVARAAAANAALPGDEAESGRGLFLIQQTTDRVEWRPREGGGTCVRLVKRR
jgi:serine/threonine-protein kinase RsbW